MVPYLKEGDYTSAFANVVDAIRIEEGIEYTWAALDVVADTEAEVVEEDVEPWTWKDTAFIMIFLLLVALVLWVAWKILKFIIFVLFDDTDFPKNTGSTSTEDTTYYYDSSSDNNHDSFSGGGRDSAGGCSNRNF